MIHFWNGGPTAAKGHSWRVHRVPHRSPCAVVANLRSAMGGWLNDTTNAAPRARWRNRSTETRRPCRMAHPTPHSHHPRCTSMTFNTLWPKTTTRSRPCICRLTFWNIAITSTVRMERMRGCDCHCTDCKRVRSEDATCEQSRCVTKGQRRKRA